MRGIDGISQLTIAGYPDEEITVSVNEEVLRSYNLTFSDVASAVANNNILVTGGAIKTEAEDYLIRVNNRSYYGKELNNIILKTEENGAIVTLGDVAVTEDAWSETPDRSYFDNQPSISFTISTTNNEDLIEAAEKATIYANEFNETHNNIQLNITNDRSQIVVERTELLLVNGIQGIALVLFFFPCFCVPDWPLGWLLVFLFLLWGCLWLHHILILR